MTDRKLITDAQGVKDLRHLRAGLQRKPGIQGESIKRTTSPSSIIVELQANLPEDDFSPQAAKEVTLQGGEWVHVREVQVRKVTAAAISAGSEEEPVRTFAYSVGNLGWVVSQGETSSTTTPDPETDSTGCCGCSEPDDYASYDWGNGDEPKQLRFYGPSLSCCGQGTSTLLREIEDETWTSEEVSCGDGESTLQWEFDGSTMTGTHSVEGVVAVYTLDEFDTDPFCSRRLHLDEDSTPTHNRDCTICGDPACLIPAATYLTTECFTDSEHDGRLPNNWSITVEFEGFVREGLMEFQYFPGFDDCNWAVCTCEVGCYRLWFDAYNTGAHEWELYAVPSQGFGNCGGAPGPIPPLPIVTWTDEEWNPQGVNSKTVTGANNVLITYTLRAS